MNVPSFLTIGKRISLFALVILAMAFAASAQPRADVSENQHCANGDFGSPLQPCDYQNGNLNGQNSQWSEGEFVPMRIEFTGLTVDQTYTVKISWDTTIGGKHAYDYLGTYDSTQSVLEGNDPCAGIAGCTITDTYPIPIDPNVGPAMIAGHSQIGGQFFTCFNCDITSVGTPGSEYTLVGTYAGTSTTSIIVTFVAKSSSPVLAFSGHVASRLDWGALNSAVAVSGSPYHWAVNDGPNRQMKVEAKGFPARLTIIKQIGETAAGSSNIFFPFDLSNDGVTGDSDFYLQDNNNDADGFSDRISIPFPLAEGETASVSITELAAGFGWSVSNIVCVDTSGGLGFVANSTPQAGQYLSGSTATANMSNAEFVTCTFQNVQGTATAAPVSLGGRVTSSIGRAISGVDVTLTDMATGEARTTKTNTFGYYRFDDVSTTAFYGLSVTSKRYVFRSGTQYFTLSEDNFDMNFQSSN